MKTVKADERCRIEIPGIKAGQVFAVETEGGTVTLTTLNHVEARTIMGKLVKRGGFLTFVMPDGSKVAAEGIAQALREDRDALTKRGIR